ncbi:hypothetical protein HYALB_00002587 [Hymenoscyphus albidus]|uniref:Uncharacterized protein n=1 Tax=Hymenoscyphus albidus TaxID=595503 RepID=A0A9N9LY50_9HELO|nr:hypothetical protein HYALB_00002587 [Hymenoscyphus albidus]
MESQLISPSGIISPVLWTLGRPMPKYNLLFGHLLTMKTYIDKLPPDAHPAYSFGQIAKDGFPNGVFYLDMWPFFMPLLVSPKKPKSLVRWFQPIAGGPNLFTMEEELWKSWRGTFNPGFSQAHIIKLVPKIVNEALAYRRLLFEYAERAEIILLDEETLWFTMDMIGALVLESNLDSKKTKTPLAVSLLDRTRWHLGDATINPFVRYYPPRLFAQWRNSKRMNAYIGRELDLRYEAYKTNLKLADNWDSKSVIGLVLEGYLKENGGTKELPATTTRPLKTLKKLREEHDTVLGKDPTSAASVITSNPQTLNQLVYTPSVIKEAMRLFPHASGARQGVDGVDITDDEGNRYPTGNTMVWIIHQGIQRNPKYWPKPDEFIPERWMTDPGDPMYPTKWAWRPFEFGPRNCVGQGLVMSELKVILALTAREFDVKDSYEEFDRLHPRKSIVTVDGERAYQFESGGAHPADHMPCRVFLRK